MPNTYVKISTLTASGGAVASFDFTSIPQTYTDLKLVLSARGSLNTETRDDFQFVFNGVGSGYSRRRILGYDSSVIASDSASGAAAFNPTTTANNASASIFGSLEFYIPNYTSANNKSFSTEEIAENNSSTSWIIGIQAGLWSNTAAITQITMTPYVSRTFLQYSTATLYGIKSS
jgi:hypothetical protein